MILEVLGVFGVFVILMALVIVIAYGIDQLWRRG